MNKLLFYITCFLLGSSIAICINQYFKLRDIKECIEDNLCIEYYKKYKLFNMHDESYKLYLEFNNKKIN